MGNCLEAMRVADARLERRCRRKAHLQLAMASRPAPRRPGLTTHRPPFRAGNLRRGALVAPAHRRFEQDYELTSESLGSGMSGDVFLARPRRGGSDVAVKTLNKAGLSARQMRRLEKEVNVYLDMDHAHIAQLLQVYVAEDKVYLVMEHCSGGNLLSRLGEQRDFSERDARDALHQIVKAVVYCHGRPGGAVCHRDLKPENVVYSSKDRAAPLKLVDFGLSWVAEPGGQPARDAVGTLDFIAPEVLTGCGHGAPVDMWAVGVIAHLLLTKRLPFDEKDDAEQRSAIVACRVDFEASAWQGVSRQAREFVARLLRADPAERMTADEALRHAWLSQRTGCTPWLPRLRGEALQRLRAFAGMGAARRACCALAVYGHVLSQAEDVSLAEEQFQALDKDGNGAIEPAEFTSALAEQWGVSLEEGHEIFQRMDLTGENRIERTQFLAAVLGGRLLGSSAVKEAFQRFDADGSGSISRHEMTELLGQRFCGENVAKIFGEMDTNSDSTVDFDEFSLVVAPV